MKAPGKNYTDTACFVPKKMMRNDSLILYRFFKHSYVDTFIVDLNDFRKAYYSGEPFDKGRTIFLLNISTMFGMQMITVNISTGVLKLESFISRRELGIFMQDSIQLIRAQIHV